MSKLLRARLSGLLLALCLITSFAVASPHLAASYRGNADSKIFHQSSCRYYNCKACTRTFMSRDEAVSAGYAPCKICKP